MADLTIAGSVAPCFPDQAEIYPVWPNVAVAQGQSLAFNSSGRAILGNATDTTGGGQQARGVAGEAAGSRQGVSCIVRGHVYGYNLSSLPFGQPIYLSDTPGALATTPGSVKTVQVGMVVPLSDGLNTPVLFLDFRRGWNEGWGSNASQVLTIGGGATGGTFTQTFNSQTTSAITYASTLTAATVQTALAGLSSIGAGNVTVRGNNGGPYYITFVGSLGLQQQPAITNGGAGSLTGGTPTIANTILSPGS